MASLYTNAQVDFADVSDLLQLLTDKFTYYDKSITGFSVKGQGLLPPVIEVFGQFSSVDPIEGTITDISITTPLSGFFLISGLSFDLDEFITLLNQGTAAAVAKIFENADTIHGGGFDDFLQGHAGADTITGWGGDDMIDGGTGADTMFGRAGNDTFFVDDAGDQAIEFAGEGIDLVRSVVTHALSAEVENLTLMGGDNINGIGNELANTIVGNTGNNTINGGLGADMMKGGAGDDTYLVENIGDVVVEGPGQGTDLVVSTMASYTLGADVENLSLLGSAADVNGSGTGNELANRINGNAGANVLTGLAGNDQLNGSAGNDRLTGDAGNDRLDGGEGNDLLDGGEGSDVVTDGLGDDRVRGGEGVDLLTGGAGADSFVFDVKAKAANADSIADFSVLDDTIVLDNAIFKALKKDGVLKEKFFNVGKKASDGNDYVIYNEKNGKLLYDKDGEGGKGAKLVATLDAGLDLTHQDFLIA